MRACTRPPWCPMRPRISPCPRVMSSGSRWRHPSTRSACGAGVTARTWAGMPIIPSSAAAASTTSRARANGGSTPDARLARHCGAGAVDRPAHETDRGGRARAARAGDPAAVCQFHAGVQYRCGLQLPRRRARLAALVFRGARGDGERIHCDVAAATRIDRKIAGRRARADLGRGGGQRHRPHPVRPRHRFHRRLLRRRPVLHAVRARGAGRQPALSLAGVQCRRFGHIDRGRHDDRGRGARAQEARDVTAGQSSFPMALACLSGAETSTMGRPMSSNTVKQFQLTNPHRNSAGVERAINIVERALELFGAPVYVRHEVVHNKFVVDGLRNKGVVFVDELDEVPDGQSVSFSAHGVSKAVRDEAARRGLKVFDATCPLVTKVHLEVERHRRAGRESILIGHAGHPEVEGTMGQWEKTAGGGEMYLVQDVNEAQALAVRDPDNIAFVTQTTLSVDDTAAVIDALRARFPHIIGPRKDDICYATQNRQDAVKALAARCDVLLVVGSPTSSNSNRLRELAVKRGVPAYLIDGAEEIQRDWLDGKHAVGVTAGASAPEVLVQEVIAKLRGWGAAPALEMSGKTETIVFALPKELNA